MADDSAVQEAPYTSTLGAVPIDQLVRDATPDYGIDTTKMKSDLTDVARQKVAATDTAFDRQLDAQKANYSDLKSKLAGVGPLNVQPWDADKEKADRVRSPLEDFGSTAGIFAMIASAFTKTPLDSALNAGAAAINGARANDFDAYDKAHTAWKENTDLAIKNHEIERQAFKDASDLYEKDPVAGGAELKAVAARFGAKAEMAMIDSGYVEKVFDIQKAKSDAAQKLITQLPQLAALDETTRTQMLSRRAVSEENAKRQQQGQPPLSAQEEAQVIGDVKRSATQSFGTFSASKMDEVSVERRAADIVKENPQMPIWDARLQAQREAGQAKSHLTGNQMDKLRGHIDLVDESMRHIDSVENVLERYVGAAGIASRPLRLKERLGNIIGSNQTDRTQMMRDIEYLRLNAPRLLTDSAGRPLAADVSRVNSIVAGLEFGDTGANTLRALEELKGIYTRSRASTLQRLNPTASVTAPGAAPAPPAGSGNAPASRGNPWENDPVIK